MQPGSALLEEPAYTIHFVGWQIVHYDHVSRLQPWAQHLFEKGKKYITIGGRLDRHGGHPSGSSDSTQHRQCAPVTARNTFAHSFTAARPAVASRHFCGYSALIEEDQLRRIDAAGFRQPVDSRAADRFAVLLGSVE